MGKWGKKKLLRVVLGSVYETASMSKDLKWRWKVEICSSYRKSRSPNMAR